MTSKNPNSLNRSEAGAPSATADLERRREPRFEADGQATLEVVGHANWRITGELLDVSAGGFRLLHRNSGLTTGTEVRFSFEVNHDLRSGIARVCWNRVANGRVESGFYITSQR